jgi:hypothetical protein
MLFLLLYALAPAGDFFLKKATKMAKEQELKDHEIKFKVTETLLEDAIVSGRLQGFKDRSEYMTYLLKKDIYGMLAQLNITRSRRFDPGHE